MIGNCKQWRECIEIYRLSKALMSLGDQLRRSMSVVDHIVDTDGKR